MVLKVTLVSLCRPEKEMYWLHRKTCCWGLENFKHENPIHTYIHLFNPILSLLTHVIGFFFEVLVFLHFLISCDSYSTIKFYFILFYLLVLKMCNLNFVCFIVCLTNCLLVIPFIALYFSNFILISNVLGG